MATSDEHVQLVSQVGLALEKLQKAREDPDVTLVCGTRRFRVHRSVLSDASPYFRSMFSSAWKESVTGKVEMPTISERAMEVIIEFIYREKIPKSICAWGDVCLHVAESAHFMEMPGLFSTCLHKLLKHANLNNIPKLQSVAELYTNWSDNSKTAAGISSWGLNARVQTFLARRFSRYIQKDEFLNMDHDQLEIILQHPELDVTSLEDLMRAILKWVDVDFEGRKVHLDDLLCAINPSFGVSHHVHCSIIDTVSMQSGMNDAQMIIEIVRTSAESVNTFCGSTESGKNLLFFGTDIERYPVMKTYDFKTNRWNNIDPPPYPVLDCSKAVGYGGHIYFLGVEEQSVGKMQTRITRYCPHTNAIISSSALKIPVELLGACGLHGAIYVLGQAVNSDERTNVIQRFSPGTLVCEEVNAMHNIFSPLGAFASTNYLYTVCSSKEDRNKELIRYDPLYDSWTAVTTIPQEWGAFAFAVTNEKLLLVDEELMIVYDIASDQWSDSTFFDYQLDLDKLWVFVRYGKEMVLDHNCKSIKDVFEAETPDWKKDLLQKEDFMPPRFQLHHCETLTCVVY